MHTRALLLLGGGLSLLAPCRAISGDAPGDTLNPKYTLKEIVVTATRGNALLATVPSGVTLISRSTIEAAPGTLLSSALDGVTGLAIRSYGGGASVQTISLRGLPPEHTLVLVDGQRYNSFQNGLADFGLIPSSAVDRVEVVKGGYSALYGADAVGGVINIITKSPPDNLTAGVSAGTGSSGYSAFQLNAAGSAGGVGARALLRRERGRGDYTFDFNDGRTTTRLRRRGEDYSVLTGDARLSWAVAPGLNSSLGLTYADADRGSPGGVTDTSADGRARLSDRNAMLRGGVTWTPDAEFTIDFNGSAQYTHELYTDPRTLINGSEVVSDYTNRAFILTPSLRYIANPSFTAMAGLEYASASLVSNEVNDARRTQRSAFLSLQHTIALPFEVPFEAILYPSIRYDGFSGLKGDASPKIGINIGLLREPGLRLRASYGRSFHAPVLNELYWKAGGNADLRPERAVSFDAGVHAEIPLAGGLRLDASYFSSDTRDRIVWLPGAGGVWSPKNIASVQSTGAEAEASWTGFEGGLILTLNSTWTDVKKTSADFPGDPTTGKRLVYSPRQTAFASAEFRMWGAGLVIRNSWYSYRYTTEMNDRFLPSFSVTSAALSITLPAGGFSATAKLEVNNLFDTSYQLIASYPMPLREIRGTVGVEL